MSTTFDGQMFHDPVFRLILGIEPGESIDDWYSLLGVDRFEADETRLDQAMLGRFELVRRYQVGKYEDQSLRLLDALGRAYACLTDEQERREYDQTLAGHAGEATIETAPPEGALDAPIVAAPRTPAPSQDAMGAFSAPAADQATCSQCGKPTSPRAPVCYQCGYRKPTQQKPPAEENRRDEAAGASPFRDLVRQDLTPQQLLARLQESRKLNNAAKRAAGIWRAPTIQMTFGRKASPGEASSRCRRCSKGLMRASDAYGLFDADVRCTLEFAQTYARKLESLGRARFDWPLNEQGVRRVQQLVPAPSANSVTIYCQACAVRILRSPKVTS